MSVLSQKLGPLPVYAYLIGGVILIGGGFVYLRVKAGTNTGSATVAPQTNYADPNSTPLPYPDPGSGAAGVPPSSAFDVSGATSVPQFGSQANFNPVPAASTTSQNFAAATSTGGYVPAPMKSTNISVHNPGSSSSASQFSFAAAVRNVAARAIAQANQASYQGPGRSKRSGAQSF